MQVVLRRLKVTNMIFAFTYFGMQYKGKAYIVSYKKASIFFTKSLIFRFLIKGQL